MSPQDSDGLRYSAPLLTDRVSIVDEQQGFPCFAFLLAVMPVCLLQQAQGLVWSDLAKSQCITVCPWVSSLEDVLARGGDNPWWEMSSGWDSRRPGILVAETHFLWPAR